MTTSIETPDAGYWLATGPAEIEHLTAQAETYAPEADALLDRIGLTDAASAIDVGCGVLGILPQLRARVGPAGRVVGLDVEPRLLGLAAELAGRRGIGIETVRADAAATGLPTGEFDLVHARALLQHLAQREAVLDAMIAAAKPGGWIVVSDVDWIQYDAQPVPEPFATLSRVLRELSSSQHGYDGTWGRMLVDAFTARGLADVDGRGEVWTMRGGKGIRVDGYRDREAALRSLGS